MTAEVYDQVSYADVRESINITLGKLEEAAEQLVWQIENRVWTVLGYGSWDEMREAEYGGAVIIVPRADRPELVSRLRANGLTQKEIADTLGVVQSTIATDVRNIDSDNTEPATRIDSIGRERPVSYQRQPEPPVAKVTETTKTETYIDTATGEILDPQAEERRRVRTADDEAAYWRQKARVQWNDFLIRALEFLAFDAVRLAADYDPDAGRTKPATAELLDQATAGIAALRKELGL